MLNLTARSAKLGRTVQRVINAGMATAAPRIGDTRVEMSPLEKGNYINYQRIEDNLSVVRSRSVFFSRCPEFALTTYLKVEPPPHALREDSLWSFG